MKHPLVVLASSGVSTNLAWWQTLSVDGDSLVVENAGHGLKAVLVVASFSSEREAQSLMDACHLSERHREVWKPPYGQGGHRIRELAARNENGSPVGARMSLPLLP
jgi:hypothetical protein